MNLLMPLAERARFENPEASETIGPDLTSSFSSQSLREEPEIGEEPVRQHDRTREFCHSLATEGKCLRILLKGRVLAIAKGARTMTTAP
jgi:hypothetical protein